MRTSFISAMLAASVVSVNTEFLGGNFFGEDPLNHFDLDGDDLSNPWGSNGIKSAVGSPVA